MMERETGSRHDLGVGWFPACSGRAFDWIEGEGMFWFALETHLDLTDLLKKTGGEERGPVRKLGVG